MSSPPQAENTRVPLMPPQATLKAFVLHFFVALMALLVFGYAAYLFCWWLQPVDFHTWHVTYQLRNIDLPMFATGALPTLFYLCFWKYRFCDPNQVHWLTGLILLLIALVLGWSRRRHFQLRTRHFILPCLIVCVNLSVLVITTLFVMHFNGRTYLGFAARKGQVNRVRLMLWLGADPYESVKTKGLTPAVEAIIYDQLEITLLFMKHSRPPRPISGEMLCLAAGWPLRVGFDKSTLGTNQQLAADQSRGLQIVNQLLDIGADPNYLYDGPTQRPLQSAAKYGNVSAMDLLLAKGALLDATDANGRTALHHAAYGGSIDSIEFLIAHGANVNIKDKQGFTPLDDTSPIGLMGEPHPDAARVLKEHGAVVGDATTNRRTWAW